VSGVHICSFSSGSIDLDELRRSDQRDPLAMLLALKDRTRISCFEITATQDIARTVDRLEKWGLIKITPEAYPWSRLELTPAGLAAWVAKRVEPPPPPAPILCHACGKPPRGRHVLALGDGSYLCGRCWKAGAQ
jgi:hypothetical protein